MSSASGGCALHLASLPRFSPPLNPFRLSLLLMPFPAAGMLALFDTPGICELDSEITATPCPSFFLSLQVLDSAAAGALAEEAEAIGEDEEDTADAPATLSDTLRRAFEALIASPDSALFECSAAAAAARAASADEAAAAGGECQRQQAVLVLPKAGASPDDLRAVGRLLAKAFIEGISLEAPLAPTALAALLGRLGGGTGGGANGAGGGSEDGVLTGVKTALDHLSAWDPAESERLWMFWLAGESGAGDAGDAAPAGAEKPAGAAAGGGGHSRRAAVLSAAAAQLLGGGRREALAALGVGFAEIVQRAGLGDALGFLDEGRGAPPARQRATGG